MTQEQYAEIAHEQGANDAEFDGVYMDSELPCTCPACRDEYRLGWNEGMRRLERAFEAVIP